MKVLVACEESQSVTLELRKLGHEAYSCDIEPCSGGHPEWHLQQDVVPLLSESWDMIIAFPPCTHLSSSGARHFEQKRKDGRQQSAVDFFLLFTKVSCPRVAIENPIGIMSTLYRKPDQIIQPWQFGHTESKATCLWLKGLPLLIPTNNVYEEMIKLPKSQRTKIHYMSPSPERSKLRSKTYEGVSIAIATQWSGHV
jgi:site-specific DNA-cytosine methylase